jgi:hypothetical protein
MLWVAMTTGARRGAPCALRWNDIIWPPWLAGPPLDHRL